jgi:hypothetical protein
VSCPSTSTMLASLQPKHHGLSLLRLLDSDVRPVTVKGRTNITRLVDRLAIPVLFYVPRRASGVPAPSLG